MEKGSLRKQILEQCPDDFQEELKDWIDEIEMKVSDIIGKLEIRSLSDLDQIEDAYRAADDLYDGLY